MSIFLDASFLLASFAKSEDRHNEAVELERAIDAGEFDTLYSSDYIFDEVITHLLARTKNKTETVRFGESLLQSKIEFIDVTPDVRKRAWAIFKTSSNLSFTDCTTAALLEMRGIRHLATFDTHFRQLKNVRILPA